MYFMNQDGNRLRSRLIITGTVLACLVAMSLLVFSPSSDGRYAILAPSGMNASAIVAAAGASVVSASAEGRFAVAWSPASDLRRRLAAAGALAVFNPALAVGCGS
jgi:hypothetical protein